MASGTGLEDEGTELLEDGRASITSENLISDDEMEDV